MFSPIFNPTGVQVNGATHTTIGVTGTATAFAPPTNAVAFFLESESSNSGNLRWACGIAANSTVGMLMEPGRDCGYVYAGVTLSVASVSSTLQVINLQWFTGV